MDIATLVGSFLAGFGPHGVVIGAAVAYGIKWYQSRNVAPAAPVPPPAPVAPPAPAMPDTPVRAALLSIVAAMLARNAAKPVAEVLPWAHDLDPAEALELLGKVAKK